jgi:hypothetical protein
VLPQRGYNYFCCVTQSMLPCVSCFCKLTAVFFAVASYA